MELNLKYPKIGVFRIHKKSINKIIDDVEINILKKINIFNMESAVYSVSNLHTNHYGLNQKYYTHFTSPIRRYADIMVHRLILDDVKINQKQMEIIINHVNNVQKNAKKAQREAELIKIIYELADCVETDGYIIGFNENKADMWIPHLKIRTYSTIYSTKLGDIVDYVKKNNKLFVRMNGKEMFQLKLGQKIKIKLIPVIRDSNFKNKLIVQLLHDFVY